MKKLIHSRSVMIALAVVALMTLTAGVAAAASMKAKFEATGHINEVDLALGGEVGAKFRIDKKTGDIKSVKIRTVGEKVLGGIDVVAPCTPKGKHSEDACAATEELLEGSAVISIHQSTATLKVSRRDAYVVNPNPLAPTIDVIWGTLKGNLKTGMTIEPAGAFDDLEGTGKLRIRSVVGTESAYGCFTNEAPYGFGSIDTCIAFPGPHSVGFVLPDGPPLGPIMVPIELHVTDSGSFKLSNDDTKIKGKLEVTVHSGLAGAVGTISVTKGEATFSIEKAPKGPKKGKGGDDDDDD